MVSFVCPQCKSTHEGLPSDYAFALPDDVWAIPEAERSKMARWQSDLCQLGERHFIRGLLPIRFLDTEGYFGWGLWVEVAWPVFERYLEIYNQDATNEPPAVGKLANRPSGYSDIPYSPVIVSFGMAADRPMISFDSSVRNALAEEQRSGMSSERYHEILNGLGAGEP